MGVREREDEIYENYQREIRGIEEEREDFERKKKKYENYRERREMSWREARSRMETLPVRWDNSQESGEMMFLLEQMIAGEKSEQEKREQALKEELAGIQKRRSECEERYRWEKDHCGKEEEK